MRNRIVGEILPTEFLAAHGLDEGQFLCCLTRLRFTPYWSIPARKRALDAAKHARNEAMKEADHRAIRDAIIAVVRETPLKVLLCPEPATPSRRAPRLSQLGL